ncbi:MAG: CRISPR-associated endonuclease Cas2 [Eubacterium sp.]
MLVLITYDVNTTSEKGRKRLSQIAKACVAYGQRVQNSVFECDLDMAKFVTLKNRLLSIYDPDKDSIRFYNLGNNYAKRIEHYGKKTSYDPEGVLML